MQLPKFSPTYGLNNSIAKLYNTPFGQVVTLMASYAVAMQKGHEHWQQWRDSVIRNGGIEAEIVQAVYPHELLPELQSKYFAWYPSA